MNCTACPINMFSGTWNNTIDVEGDCLVCPSGSNTDGSTGQTECLSCFDGYYGNPPYNCTPCQVDTYSDTWEPDSTIANCSSCPLGSSTSNTTGQTSCMACLDGHYGTAPDSCIPCPPDMYYNGSWVPGSTLNSCLSCPLGSSTLGAPGQTSCTACIDGWYGAGPHNCTACPNDTFAPFWVPGSSLSLCQICPPGYTTSNATGQTFCLDCKNGFYGTAGLGGCWPCPPDTYYPSWVLGSTIGDCISCPLGSTTFGAHGQAIDGQIFCRYCLDGYFGAGHSDCSPCPFDTFYAIWSPDSTSLDCVPCSSGGSTAGLIGQTSCIGKCFDKIF